MRKHVKLTALGVALMMAFVMCSCSKPRGSGVVQNSAPSKPEHRASYDEPIIDTDVTETDPDFTDPTDVEPTDTVPSDTLPTETTPDGGEPTVTSPSRPAAAENAPVFEGTHEELMAFLKSLIGKDVTEAETMLEDFFNVQFKQILTVEHDDIDRYSCVGYYYIYDIEVNMSDLKCEHGTTTVSQVSFWTLDYSKEDCAEDIETITGLLSEECGEPYRSTPVDLDAGAGWGNYSYQSEDGYDFFISVFVGEEANSATITFDIEKVE